MKNMIKLFVAVVASVMTITACQKGISEESAKSTHTVMFTAGAPETKTNYNTDGQYVNYSWSTTDATDKTSGGTKRPEKFQVFENGIRATSVDAVLDNGSMTIGATFTNTQATSFKYQAQFNRGVSAEQSSSDDSYDQNSDVLISDVVTSESKVSQGLVFKFKREVAMAVVTLKGLEKGNYLYNVKIESDKPLAGIYNKDTQDTHEWENTSNTLSVDSYNEINGGEVDLRFITIPVDAAMLKVTVQTTDDLDNVVATYVKEFTKSISFTRGNVRPFNVNLEGCEVIPAVDKNISWEGASDWDSDTDNDEFYLKTQPYGYSVVLKKNNGGTAPTVNATAKDCRLYAKGTATISNSKDITRIVFNISEAGKKRLAPITASVGTIATQASGDETVVWTGKAKEITFTVGERADYGSESDKAGQLDFSSIDATYLDDGSKPTEYNIEIDNNISGGTVSADPESAVENTKITLTVTPDQNKKLKTLTVTNASTSAEITTTDAGNGKYTFQMPDANVNVTATFGDNSGGSIEINTTNSGVTGSYADKTFDVDGVTFGFTQWMKSTNIQAKKSTTNSCYNVDAIPGAIKKITVVQTGTARAIKVYGGTSSKPTTEISAPSTAATMEFDFSGKNYTYFSMTTPSNAVYINTITIEY